MTNKSIKQTGRSKFITEDDYREILALAKEDSFRNYFLLYLAGNLGLRVGELILLKKQSFNLEKALIYIPIIKMKREGKEFNMLACSEKMKETFLTYCNSYNIVDWLFKGGEKGHLSKRQVQSIFYKYAQILDIKASIHSLRHYRGFRIFEETQEIAMVKYGLRHGSVSSALIYTHPSPKLLRSISDAVEEVE